MDAGEKLVPAGPEDLEDLEDPERRKLYQHVISVLMFAMICTRIDLAYPVAKLSRFMTISTGPHLSAAKRVLRYIAHSLTQLDEIA